MNKPTQSLSGPILVVMRGLPGSGKSYLAQALADSLGKERVVLLDPDAIDMTSKAYTDLADVLRAEGVEEKFYPNRFLKEQAYAAVRTQKIIVWNQPFTDPGGFERTIDSVRTFASENAIPMPILLVEVEVDPAVAWKRTEERRKQGGHGPSADRFARFIDDYVSFADKGYKTVIVSGEDNVANSVESVLGTLYDL